MAIAMSRRLAVVSWKATGRPITNRLETASTGGSKAAGIGQNRPGGQAKSQAQQLQMAMAATAAPDQVSHSQWLLDHSRSQAQS